MSIRAKFLAILTLILIFGVGTTGTVLILQNARHDQVLLAEKQLLLVEHAAFALQGNLSVAARELLRLSKLPEIDPADNDIDPERQLLYSAHENSVFFKEVRILDENGRVSLVQPADGTALGKSFAERRWFETAKKAQKPFFYSSPEHAAVPDGIAVVVPVHQDGRFMGAIQGILDLHNDKVLTPELSHTVEPSGEFVLVDRDGRAIFPPGDNTLESRGWGSAVHELGQGKSGSRHVADKSGDFMYAFAPVGIAGWGVAMRWPWSALTADRKEQVESTAAVLLVGMLGVGLIAFAFAAYLSRPLLALGEVAARLARGEKGGVPKSNRGDEVGVLYSAFHHMEDELAASDQKIREDFDTITRLNTSLEERVRARTRELELAQARLLDVERFAAMGKTAAAIAHELRNALNGLGMCVDLVLADVPANKNSSTLRVRAQIHFEIARLRDVTESLLTFSRAPRLERAPVDVNQVVVRALEVLAEQISDGGVTVRTDLAGGVAGDRGAPLLALCDGYKLQGVLINLIKNAVEAMTTRPLDLSDRLGDTAGPVDTTGAARALAPAPTTAEGLPVTHKNGAELAPPRDPVRAERRLSLATRRVDHAHGATEVIIEIADTGPGLLPEARKHLFEPFYTTKVTGTGLGLTTSRRIVEAHGGTIEIGDPEPLASTAPNTGSAPGNAQSLTTEGALVRVRIPAGDLPVEDRATG